MGFFLNLGQYAIQAIYQFLINEQKWIYTKFVADDNEILLPNNMNVLPNSFSPFEDFARIGSSGYTFAQVGSFTSSVLC